MSKKAVFNGLVEFKPAREHGSAYGQAGYDLKFPTGETLWVSRASFDAQWIVVDQTEGLEPHMVRVAGETAQLKVRLERLGEFLTTKTFQSLSQDDREVLRTQCQAMQEQLLCLRERLVKARNPTSPSP